MNYKEYCAKHQEKRLKKARELAKREPKKDLHGPSSFKDEVDTKELNSWISL